MIRTDKRLRLCAALLICNFIFIWGNSLLPGEISGAFSDWVKEILETLFQGTPDDTHGGIPLRKLAHFTEFACLGGLLFWYLGMLGKPKKLAFCIGAAAACMDETIQIFVPGRGPGIRDVCIDCGGVLTGMVFVFLGYTYFKRKRNNQTMEDV